MARKPKAETVEPVVEEKPVEEVKPEPKKPEPPKIPVKLTPNPYKG